MQIGELTLVNEEKLERAIHGTVGRAGAHTGGVGEDASDEAILAEYDRLAGLITKNGETVKTGSFYDFKERKPREEPEIVLLFTVNGQVVEVPDGAPLPLAVRAQQVLDGEAEELEEEKPVKKPVKRARKA